MTGRMPRCIHPALSDNEHPYDRPSLSEDYLQGHECQLLGPG